MIKITLLKDAVADKGVVFAKATVEGALGFAIEVAVGHITKPKELVCGAGTVVMELPDSFLDKLTVYDRTFEVEATGEVKQITMMKLGA